MDELERNIRIDKLTLAVFLDIKGAFDNKSIHVLSRGCKISNKGTPQGTILSPLILN